MNVPSRKTQQERIREHLSTGQEAADSGDWVAATRSLLEAAKLGDRRAQELVGNTASPHLKQAADAGNTEAQALLAGVLMDYFEESTHPMAADYATQAAEAGNAEAKRTLGFMHQQGIGVAQDPQRAFELWTEASNDGDGYAAFNLSVLHANGDAPDSSENERVRLLELAAERGVVNAGAVLGDRLAAADRDEEALTWYLWAAERGHTGSMWAAGCWYRDGIGTLHDPVQAMRWYLTLLGYGNGDGVHESIKLAKSGMSDEQIREAGRLSGHPNDAETTIRVARKHQDS